MKISKDEIMEFAELLSEAESFRPLIRMALDALKSYSEELREIPEAIGNWMVERRIAMIKKYESSGFTRDDSIIMTLDDIYGLRKMGEKFNRKQSGKD